MYIETYSSRCEAAHSRRHQPDRVMRPLLLCMALLVTGLATGLVGCGPADTIAEGDTGGAGGTVDTNGSPDSTAAKDTGTAGDAFDKGDGGGSASGDVTAEDVTAEDVSGTDTANDPGKTTDTATGSDAGGVKEVCNGVDDDKDGLTDEGACDDGDLCTADTCDADNKQCSWDKIGEGESCDDGDACTQKEKCLSNKCISTESTQCDDGDPCTASACNKSIGICEHPPTADGGACDDGDPCTEKGACSAGKCSGSAKVCDDGEPCTTDACVTGKGCTTTANDGGSCDDGEKCTTKDVCSGGTCSGEFPKGCKPSGPCEIASCDAKTGSCKKSTKPAGSACDDGDACTTGEACTGAQCSGGKAVSCAPGTACEPNVCDAKTGKCSKSTFKDGKACNDGNACTTQATCQGGKCIDIGKKCDDNNVCTTDSCDPKKGCQYKAAAGTCEDGDLCTTGEACKGGKCLGAKAKTCDDGSSCTVDSCTKLNGTCVNDTKLAEGKPCNDDNSVCTSNESCKAGKCQGGTAKTCSDGKACTADNCDAKTGVCTFPPAKAGAPCDDDSYCTFGDSCDVNGKCGGKTFPCDDKNPCTTDACIPKSGKCSFTPKKSGDLCDDNDNCTTNDTCSAAGKCVAGAAKNCNDGNNCTTDACTPATGKCTNTANSNACNDGSICTIGDACIGGKCKSGADGSVTVYAGSSGSGYVNGVWSTARFGYPLGITGDEKGGFYVADRSYHRIRYISANRVVSTAAGSGSSSYLDGAALSARFRNPSGVAYNKATGGLYIADTYNHCIRLLNGGQVTTVVGRCGTSSGYYGYANGTGAAGRLYYPEGLAITKDGAVIVADRANSVIRRIVGRTISLLAGIPKSAGFLDGQATASRFNNPYGVSVSDTGVVFVADTSNARIRAIHPSGVVTTVAGGSAGYGDGYKTQARFNTPYDVVWTKGGFLLVADANNHRIRRVTLAGVVTTFSGVGTAGFADGKAGTARFYYPRGIATDAKGNAYVSDSSNRRIRKVIAGVLTCRDENPCTLDKCDAKKGCSFAKIATGSACEDGATCQTGGTCSASGACSGTKPKCKDAGPCTTTTCDALSGSCVFKAEGSTCNDGDPCTEGEACALGKCSATVAKVSTLSGNGKATTIDGIGASASHYYPRGMGHDKLGNVYVADYSGHRIRRISATGAVTTVGGSGSAGFTNGPAKSARFYYPTDVAAHSDGSLFVSDRQNQRIRRIDGAGNVTTYAGSGSAGFTDGPAATARFYYPESLDVDVAGNVFVADQYNNRIRKIAPNGTVSTFVGNGSSGTQDGLGTAASIYRPSGVAVGPGGVVYFASYYHHTVRQATAAGLTRLLAGTTQAGFSDGTGASARFKYPADLAVDGKGRVLVADRGNHRIRRIDANGTVTTIAGGTAGFLNGSALTAKLYYPYGVTAIGETAYVGDSNNYRIRIIKPPVKDCDDFDPCSVDSCNAKTGVCAHKAIADCCSPVPYTENFNKTTVAAKMAFYTCTPDKFSLELKGCKLDTDGAGPRKGWQVHADAFVSRSAPGALYYGNGVAGNYNWGANAGKVLTAEMLVPKGTKTKLSFWVYFDTEAPQAFDKFYMWLWVDGKRVQLGSQKSPNFGALWYKGKPGYTAVKTWSQVELDVSAYRGKKLRIEATFNTGDGLKNFGVGAFIDDIQLFTQCGK